MTYISLYRKWRPQAFSEVVGQEHISRTLANAVTENRVAHAYLFSGPRGTGKTSSAKILAKSINCLEGPTPEPCGKCASCVAISGGHSLDVIEMDAASNRGIEEIRDLRDKVAFAAAAARRKVYIIDEVHMLTEPAFNALLKTIEEPPAHVVFVLATTDPHKVPATIASRCQQFEFRRISLANLISHLGKIAAHENIGASKAALAVVARHAEGSLRDAIGMLDQLSSATGQELSEEEVAAFLGLPGAALVEEAMDLIIAGEVARVFEFVEALTEAGRDLRQFVAAMLGYARDLFILIHVRNDESRKQLIHRGDEVIERMIVQAETLGAERIRTVLSECGRLFDELRYAAEPRLALELALVGLIRGEGLSLEALAARITRLEENGFRAAPRAPVEAADAPAVPLPEKPAARKTTAGSKADLAEIKLAWPEILAIVRKKKLSLGAFLVECRPTAIADGIIELTFSEKSDFAMVELAKKPNSSLLREAIAQVLQTDFDFSLQKGSGRSEPQVPERPKAAIASPAAKTPAAVKEAAPDPAPAEDAMIDLLKESFGAEIVD